jgi:8-oxo-dGTP diphosphatase
VKEKYENPTPTVDAVIFWRSMDHILLIERKNPPYGLALPGGFVNVGETLEEAIKREVREELGIGIFLMEQFYTYSHPLRDPRKHIMSTVFIALSAEDAKAGDDAKSVISESVQDLIKGSRTLAFDHLGIIRDVERYMRTGQRRKLEK